MARHFISAQLTHTNMDIDDAMFGAALKAGRFTTFRIDRDCAWLHLDRDVDAVERWRGLRVRTC